MPARGGLEVEPTTRPRPNRLPLRSARGTPRVQSGVTVRPRLRRYAPLPVCGFTAFKMMLSVALETTGTRRAVSTSPDRSRLVPTASDTFTRHSMIVPFTVHQNPHSTLLLPPRTTAPQGVHRDAPRHTVIIHRFQIVAVVHLHATVETFSLSLRLPAGMHDPTPHSPGEPQCRSV